MDLPCAWERGFLLCIFFVQVKGFQNEISKQPSLIWSEVGGHVTKVMQMSVSAVNHMSLFNRQRTSSLGDVVLETRLHKIGAFSLDEDDGIFLLADRSGKDIKQLSRDKNGLRECTLFTGTSSEVHGMTIDWTINNVYWSDAAYDVILVQNYGTCPPKRQPIVLIGSGLDEPMGIVAFPEKGLLFWADAGRSPRIGRSSLAGRGISLIVERNLKKPTHVAIDYEQDRVYWLDAGTGWLSSCDLDGARRTNIIQIDRAAFGSFVLYRNRAYVTEQRRRALYIINTLTESVIKRVVLKNSSQALQLIGTSFQKPLINPCANFNCSGICVRQNLNSSECACSQNVQSADQLTGNCKDEPFQTPTFPRSLFCTKRFGLASIPENFADFRFKVEPRDVVYSKSYRPLAVTSDIHRGLIYFSDAKANAILRMRHEANSKVEQIALTLGKVEGLVVDWTSGNLYWTDSKKKAVLVSNQSAKYIHYFIHKESYTPRFLAIHPGRRKLYFMTSEPKIYQCYLDGSYREVLVADGISNPTSLILDIRQERLYWSDIAFGHIVSCNVDGSDRRVIHTEVTSMIKTMTIVKDYLVYADWFYNRRGLHAVNTKTGHYVGHLADASLMNGLCYHHWSSQPLFQNSCGHDNAGCQHLCLPNFYNYTCKCGIGYRLATDGKHCETDLTEDKFILVADQRLGVIFQLDLWRYQYHALPLQEVNQPYSVTFNPVEDKVYWSDVIKHTINRAFLNGSHQEIILARENLGVVKLALEENSGLLFYLDVGDSIIGVIAVTTLYHRTLVSNITEARDFTIDAEHGYLLVSSKREITRYSMDGSLEGVNNVNNAVGISADISANRLFWFDSLRKEIRTCGLTNLRQVSAVRQIENIRALDVDPHYIYWIDAEEGSIYRSRKADGEGEILLGEPSPFFLPVSLFVQRGRKVAHNSCSKRKTVCSHICLPIDEGFKCACPDGMLMKRDQSGCYMQADDVIQITGLCVIPRISFGVTVNQRWGLTVDDGFKLSVKCLDGTVQNSHKEMRCQNGSWSHTPSCLPASRNPIYGTERRGQRVFTHSGFFVAPSGVDQVNVICIGGGGGGRDGRSFRDAGDGGTTRFGDMLVAEGGKGGKANNSGGEGGKGTVASGGRGRLQLDCGGAGGAAGETTTNIKDKFPGVSTFQFCGGGGTSDPDCLKDRLKDQVEIPPYRSGPGGEDGLGAAGGLYGGGSGGAAGARGGGGGGYSSATFQLHSRKIVPVIVGKAGSSSFARPGRGIVVVSWGGDIDPYHSKFIPVQKNVIT